MSKNKTKTTKNKTLIHTRTDTTQTKAQGWISGLACQGKYAKEESFPACEAETLRIGGCVFVILRTPQQVELHFTPPK